MVDLTPVERGLLEGEEGPAVATAMRFVVGLAEAMEAERLLDISRAHIDGCLYHGPVGLDFAERLAAQGARVRVPTTLNVGALDLLHPELYRGDAATAGAARRQMDAYVAMGCRPTWTCAPYQLIDPPVFGEQIAWAESNAIVFANSVLGARTNRYGDFIDICAAISGKVPAAGLHLDEERRAGLVVDVSGIAAQTRRSDVFFALLGYAVGRLAGSRVAAIIGIDEADTDQLKALGAGAASSGAVGLLHVVGVTPEAPTLASVADRRELPVEIVDASMLQAVRDELVTRTSGPLRSVNFGTPHASARQLVRLADELGGRRVAAGVSCYVSTGRDVAAGVPDTVASLEAAGVRVVTDTCTYVAPIVEDRGGVHMTDSAKWAHYAPANLGVDVLFASTEECIASALCGEIVADRGPFDA